MRAPASNLCKPIIVYGHFIGNKLIGVWVTKSVYGFRQYSNRPIKWWEKIHANKGTKFTTKLFYHSVPNMEFAKSLAKAIQYYYQLKGEVDLITELVEPKRPLPELSKCFEPNSHLGLPFYIERVYGYNTTLSQCYLLNYSMEINTKIRNYHHQFLAHNQ